MIAMQSEERENVIENPTQSFDVPVILLGGGDLNRPLFDEMTALGYPLVAADGGANALGEQDPVPALIVGDLDSLEERSSWQAKTAVIDISEQETTDFEKCLYTTSAPLYLAFGFLGRRFDHSLAALHVLAKYAGRKNVVLISREDVVVVPGAPFEAGLKPGTRISIYPITPVAFEASDGLAYPLDGLTLSTGLAIGTSNEVVASPVKIVPSDAAKARYAVILPVSCLPSITGDVASWGGSV